jgi:hypothetical protein
MRRFHVAFGFGAGCASHRQHNRGWNLAEIVQVNRAEGQRAAESYRVSALGEGFRRPTGVDRDGTQWYR